MPDLTMNEAAARLGVHPMTIRRYIAAGRLRAYRLGPRLVRIHAEDVERLRQGEPVGGAR
ncbi:helix-turn-helix domain-containing protein [Mycobacterium sp. IS-3022]|uniref:helix-turn-helix domain-containing protein n=1 Tax=Mycobacterium sp. IS-3022 TaxID=1772277 RepID=UPI0007417FC2|nr:helix-turn-helix domain-containing protein [Mycobacterium sp. IS-3022]KUH99270.1 hypothetical protein AU188_11460 [Mycobacterium sp. IS-3022]